MGYFEAAVLGLVQGLTEFLPVSSSGHLVLAQEVMEVTQTGVLLEVLVHLATAASVMVYFRKDLIGMVRDSLRGGPGRGLTLRVLVGTVPAVAIYLAFKRPLEQALENPFVAASCLIVTGGVLLSTRWAKARTDGDAEPGFGHAIVVGCAQAVAILPGISRSGSTISAALFLGEDPKHAARFSFLLSLPVILGAGLLQGLKVASGEEPIVGETAPLVLAAVVAFLSGIAAIHALVVLVSKGHLSAFGPYCLLVGGGFLAWLTFA